MFSGILNYLGNNYIQGSAEQEEEKLRAACPFLLQDGERVVFAFLGAGGSGRDSSFLTDRRILVRDVTGITGSSVKYTSTPFSAIKAYAISTVGGGLDHDSELQVWATGMPRWEVQFAYDKVDLFAINQFLNSKVLPQEQEYKIVIPDGSSPGSSFQVQVAGQTMTVKCPDNLEPGMTMKVVLPSPNTPYTSGPKTDETKVQGFFNWLGDDATEVDPKELEERLKTSPVVLAADEHVEMAFKSGRDCIIFSTKRLFILDKRGITGKKVLYLSVLWKCARAFSVETAGSFDRDCELTIYTNIDDLPSGYSISQDLRATKCDVMAVQRFLSDKILGVDSQPSFGIERLAIGAKQDQGQGSGASGLMAWLDNDMRQLDAAEADLQFHSDPAILQGCERCEMAFKGRRDMVLFTTKRVVRINVQGWSGQKKEFLSVPWNSIKAFGVKSSGSFLDKDSEMMLWTDIMFIPETGSGDSHVPPQPGMSYLEFDFQKDKVDLMVVQLYLASRCLLLRGLPASVPVQASAISTHTNEGSLEACLNWLGGDAAQLKPSDVETHLEKAQVLLEGEHVALAFKAGRDSFILTNRRVLTIDVQGFSGKRVAYVSIPYESVRAFSVESAGSFDRDAELKIYTRNKWDLKQVSQDFRKGKADILAVQSYLSHMTMGDTAGTARDSPPQSLPGNYVSEGGVTGFLSWLGDDHHQIDPNAVQKRLTEETPILLPDEVVEAAFKCGRDMHVHTNKRLLKIDVQGWTGKRVEYLSVPLKFCSGFQLKTAGKFDLDSEVRLFTDVPAIGRINQDLRKGKADVEQYWRLIQNKLLV